MLQINQQNRLEALVAALTGVRGESNPVHSQELINFLQELNETEAICYAVAHAAAHYRVFGKTNGTHHFLYWASSQLKYPDYHRAYYFIKLNPNPIN